MKLRLILSSLVITLLATVASAQEWLEFPGKSGPGKGKRVVLISGDEEYRSEESMPMLGKLLSQHHGFDCTVLFAIDPATGVIDPNNQKNIPNTAALKGADLLIIATRFRQLPPEQLQPIADFLNAGKPVIGLRTATHAFTGGAKTGEFKWSEFGLKILGEQWVAHHGKHKVEGARGVIEAANATHPVLNGVRDVFALSDVYTVKNLTGTETILLRAAVTETLDPKSKTLTDDPRNQPLQAAAWLKDYTAPNGTAQGKAFCTTMGAANDLLNADLRRLIVNAAYHLTGLSVPALAKVDIVDPYEPTMFNFNKGDYWLKRGLKPADFALGKSAKSGVDTTAPAAKKDDGKKKKAAQ